MYDAVVVGLGGVGSFALRALAKEYTTGRFLGIERFSLGHVRGSSHGKTRIYRRAYFEHPSYVPWIEFSLSVFRELEQYNTNPAGLSLMQECGTLLMQPGRKQQQGRSSMPPLLQASWDSAQEHGIPVEYLCSADLAQRYPQFQYGDTKPDEPMVGLLEPSGGFLRPELAQEAALIQARACNESVSILEHTAVLNFNEISSSSQTWVELEIQTYGMAQPELIQTKRLLLSMGAWTGQFLPSWAPYLRVIRQVQGWIDLEAVSAAKNNDSNENLSSSLFGYQHMPTWVMQTPGWATSSLYGVPCDTSDPTSASHWLKVGVHDLGHHRAQQDDRVIRNPTYDHALTASAEEQEELQQVATRAFSLWNNQQPTHTTTTNNLSSCNDVCLADIKPCMYTVTPDCNFMIGVPRAENCTNVFAVAGLSGHGFKMAPALGQMMADFALDKDLEPWKMEFCAPSRFVK